MLRTLATSWLTFRGVSHSTGPHYDTIDHFRVGEDHIRASILADGLGGVDATVHGMLSSATFDADAALAVNGGALNASDAVLFQPTSGDLAGHTFLFIDANNVAGYQTGADYVIELTNASNLSHLARGDFF